MLVLRLLSSVTKVRLLISFKHVILVLRLSSGAEAKAEAEVMSVFSLKHVMLILRESSSVVLYNLGCFKLRLSTANNPLELEVLFLSGKSKTLLNLFKQNCKKIF
jgi:hypothetical protein